MTQASRIGLTTPILTRLPGQASDWEALATPGDLVEIARAADRLGFHHLTCSEHVMIPADVATQRGATYWDPAVTLAHLAAHTERILLATQVLVLGYHHPLKVAKQFGTLDLLSGGRVVLGVGVGSLEPEFDLLGAQFGGRGDLADDALRALRAAWGRREPHYQGTHYAFDQVVVDPCAPRTDVPVWVGGRTRRSLRRAVELGDGWVPFGLGPSQLQQMLGTVELPEGFEVVLGPGRPVDPLGDPQDTGRRLRRVRDTGATVITTSVRGDSPGHYLEQLAELARIGEQEGL